MRKYAIAPTSSTEPMRVSQRVATANSRDMPLGAKSPRTQNQSSIRDQKRSIAVSSSGIDGFGRAPRSTGATGAAGGSALTGATGAADDTGDAAGTGATGFGVSAGAAFAGSPDFAASRWLMSSIFSRRWPSFTSTAISTTGRPIV